MVELLNLFQILVNYVFGSIYYAVFAIVLMIWFLTGIIGRMSFITPMILTLFSMGALLSLTAPVFLVLFGAGGFVFFGYELWYLFLGRSQG